MFDAVWDTDVRCSLGHGCSLSVLLKPRSLASDSGAPLSLFAIIRAFALLLILSELAAALFTYLSADYSLADDSGNSFGRFGCSVPCSKTRPLLGPVCLCAYVSGGGGREGRRSAVSPTERSIWIWNSAADVSVMELHTSAALSDTL